MMISDIPLRRRPPFFDGLTDSEAHSIIDGSVQHIYLNHTPMARENHDAHYLYMLIRGHAHSYFTSNGETLEIYRLTPGDIFGLASMQAGHDVYLASTVAITDCTARRWDRPTIHALVEQYPILYRNFLTSIAGFSRRWKAIDMASNFDTPTERLLALIMSLAAGEGLPIPGGWWLKITVQELTGSTRIKNKDTATEILDNFEKQGLLKKRQGGFIVYDPPIS
jgi:CRP-like cAMP-binding protein